VADAGSGDEGSRPGGDRALHPGTAGWPEPIAAQGVPWAFEGDLGEVAFVPAPEGVFMIGSTGRLSGDSRAEGFSERAAVKRGVWDRVAPGRDTGRSDRQDAQEH
jgi:predicted Rdx family selenoprotein